MKTRNVHIDNSQDKRTPMPILKRRISSVKQPRQDWENAFRYMAKRGDDELLDKELLVQTQLDEDEWLWS